MLVDFTKIKSKEAIEREKEEKEKNKYSFIVDYNNPLNIHIWQKLGIREGIENKTYSSLLEFANKNCFPYVNPRYLLHFYLCYAENITHHLTDWYSYVKDLIENDYENVCGMDQARLV